MPQIHITVDINENTYLKDPLQTNLGKTIIRESINLFEEIGFESFNFKKLAQRMESSEASIYRYFENKYMLLTYLVSWYWDFMHFMVLMDIRNVQEPREQLHRAINTLVNSLDNTVTPEYVDHTLLHKIVVENASKVYHTKDVDDLSKVGFYENLAKLVTTLSKLILKVAPDYQYPNTLATNIVEQSLNNEYYLEHLPQLTDRPKGKCAPRQETMKMIQYMLDRLL